MVYMIKGRGGGSGSVIICGVYICIADSDIIFSFFRGTGHFTKGRT